MTLTPLTPENKAYGFNSSNYFNSFNYFIKNSSLVTIVYNALNFNNL